MTRFWFDPTAPESAAMARALSRLGLQATAYCLDRSALRGAQGAGHEGLAPALRRAGRNELERAGGGGEAPAGEPGSVEAAVQDGVFDLPALVHGGRVHRDLRLRALAEELDRPPPPPPEAEQTLPVDVYVDLSDPLSFVASTRVERLCGRGVQWRPVNGQALRRGFGAPDPLRESPELEQAWWRDVVDRAAPAPIRWSALGLRTTLASRALLQLGFDDPSGRLLLLHLFHALWLEGRDLSDRATLEATIGQLELDGARLVRDGSPATVRDATAEAETAGVFTTPTFVVGRQHFVGLDALDDAGRAARVASTLVTIGR